MGGKLGEFRRLNAELCTQGGAAGEEYGMTSRKAGRNAHVDDCGVRREEKGDGKRRVGNCLRKGNANKGCS